MVENLKRSLEDLQPPTCDVCQLEMKWYHSHRMQASPDLIAHYFHCPNCGRIKDIKTKMQAGDGNGKPTKLSAPAERRSRPPTIPPPGSAAA